MTDFGNPGGRPPSGEVWTFESAAAFWKTWETRCDEAVWAHFSAAEQYLLESRPRDAGEAALLVEVLIANSDSPSETGPLRRLHGFLGGLVESGPRGLAPGSKQRRREEPGQPMPDAAPL